MILHCLPAKATVGEKALARKRLASPYIQLAAYSAERQAGRPVPVADRAGAGFEAGVVGLREEQQRCGEQRRDHSAHDIARGIAGQQNRRCEKSG